MHALQGSDDPMAVSISVGGAFVGLNIILSVNVSALARVIYSANKTYTIG
jgi:uncharacterized membrane protein YjfL (UPF0719 family)